MHLVIRIRIVVKDGHVWSSVINIYIYIYIWCLKIYLSKKNSIVTLESK